MVSSGNLFPKLSASARARASCWLWKPIRPPIDEDKVDDFYKAPILAGARDNISPRVRLEYYPGYYAADVFDPDGYSFEVVHKS
jgi:hypothetical protein